jgi:hypothetical protein
MPWLDRHHHIWMGRGESAVEIHALALVMARVGGRPPDRAQTVLRQPPPHHHVSPSSTVMPAASVLTIPRRQK